jgi:hypothetical protein
MADKNSKLTWSFHQVWNKSLENRTERPLYIRNKIWASEIGGSYIDRYLKMNAIPPTNPPDPRALRKFEAGNMFEWVVKLVLRRAGILQEAQTWLSNQYPDLLEVTGKLDFLAGGKPNWAVAEEEIKKLELPEFFGRATEAIIKHFEDKYPEGLNEVILEVKSCSSFMFDKYTANGADKRHQLQAFHYLKAKNLPEAHITYISKDDLRMYEAGVFNNPTLEKEYKADIEQMTKYINTKTEPPKEAEIIFDQERGGFSTNWKVTYSNYLKLLYGYDKPADFEDKYKPMVAKWNRTLTRLIDDKKVTDLNQTAINEIEAWGFDIEKIKIAVKQAKRQIPEIDENAEDTAQNQ